MIIAIRWLEEVDGGVVLEAFIKRPELGHPPVSFATCDSTKKAMEAMHNSDLEIMKKLTDVYKKEMTEYTCFHLGEADLTQEVVGEDE